MIDAKRYRRSGKLESLEVDWSGCALDEYSGLGGSTVTKFGSGMVVAFNHPSVTYEFGATIQRAASIRIPDSFDEFRMCLSLLGDYADRLNELASIYRSYLEYLAGCVPSGNDNTIKMYQDSINDAQDRVDQAYQALVAAGCVVERYG